MTVQMVERLDLETYLESLRRQATPMFGLTFLWSAGRSDG